MNDMTLGQRIAEQRKKLGLSQEALGEKMGVSRQAISKWESDGAVPEIDKLIGLSRLFSVSVGWLLGVEEDTPPQPDELTESQIKMVEEIVKRYQPEPEEKAPPWFHFVLILLFLIPVISTVFSLFGPDEMDYSAQINNLQSSYQSIQSELQSLSGRVEDIASAAEEAEKLLLSHEFQLLGLGAGSTSLDPVTGEHLPEEELPEGVTKGNPIVVEADLPIAELRFCAVPKQHADSDKAWLVVLLNGQPMGQKECVWSGGGYLAELALWISDGYEYRFVVEHGDGTQQIQTLEEFQYNDLEYGTSLHCAVESFVWDYDPQAWVFTVNTLYIYAEKPSLGSCSDARWKEAGLILSRNGMELERRMDPPGSAPWNPDNYDLVREYMKHEFRSVKLEEEDELKLTFYATLDNGMSIESPVGHWVYRDGSLQLTES